jgi:hypothetical protein
MPILIPITAISGGYPNIAVNHYNTLSKRSYLYQSAFFPLRRADLTASASLQRIRSGKPQLHALCLASAATSTLE